MFQVQPMLARFILPWFGGTPAVWTTAMLFFQVMLLGGYAYTHYLIGRMPLRRQLLVHPLLLLLSLALLPITPDAAWKPDGGGDPTLQILALLLVAVGVPYLLAASTAPLMQSWFVRANTRRSPYALYAVSNAGSLLGLLAYPLLVEPTWGARQQTQLWSLGYLAFVVASVACAALLWRRDAAIAPVPHVPAASGPHGSGSPLLWLLLSACGVVMLLAATNQMCQDVAVIPLLWVLPLSLYLLSFIVAFGVPKLYFRPLWGTVLAVSVVAVVDLMHRDYAAVELPLPYQITVYSLTVFSACMVCHGELFRLRPGTERLTFYYLVLSLGGALGGMFVSLGAPLLFPGYWEYHLAILLTVCLFGFGVLRGIWSQAGSVQRVSVLSSWLLMLGVLSLALLLHVQEQQSQAIVTKRGFFGVLHVYEYSRGQPDHHRVIYHGRINHGRQYLDERYRGRATSYYGPSSGVGRALLTLRQLRDASAPDTPLRYGLVGLGAGTLAAYSTARDSMRFYEINPDVEDMARQFFSFVDDAAGRVDVVLGDARISMERELREDGPGNYDVLVIDAFSGDAIPVHLLTAEALGLYLGHLAADGALAFHISNLHFDLRPVVLGLARDAKLDLLVISDPGSGPGQSGSTWAVLSNNAALMRALASVAEDYPKRHGRRRSAPVLWTDDYANVLSLL